MTAPGGRGELAITVRIPDGSSLAGAPYAAIVRVLGADGHIVERSLRFDQTERVQVGTGVVDVNVVLSTGQLLSQSVKVDAGQSVAVHVDVPQSPREALRWLSLSRGAAPRRKPLRRHPSSAPEVLESLTVPQPKASPREYEFLQLGASTISVVGDHRYPEGRVLHLRDARSVETMREPKSGVAFLSLTDAPGATRRLCALPGPYRAQTEVHVVLRTRPDDDLQDVEVTPAHAQLGPIVGFLQRGDQRALSLMHEEVENAVELLAGKMHDPVPAAIGLSLLLRVGALSRVRGWSKNLWEWFPGLPDAAALHAAILLRDPQDSASWVGEFRRAVLGAVAAGVPLLTDSLRRLQDAVRVLHDIEPDSPSTEAKQWARRMLRASDPDELFTTLTLPEADVKHVFGLQLSDRPDPIAAATP
jgi:hypothetical protein